MADLTEVVAKLVGDVLELPESRRAVLLDTTGQYYLPEWSSVAHVQIILAIEDHWNIEVPEDQIVKLISVPKIVEYIAARNL